MEFALLHNPIWEKRIIDQFLRNSIVILEKKQYFFFNFDIYFFITPSLGIQKYVHSKFPSFDSPPPPCSCLFVFEHTSPPQGTFVLARTQPLTLNFCTCEIQRKEINNKYQYLWLNSTFLIRSHSGISIKWTPLLLDKSGRFMEMSALQRVHLKSEVFKSKHGIHYLP